MKQTMIFFLVALLMPAAMPATAGEAIGGLRKVSGTAFIERNNERIAAKDGLAVMQNDVIKTGKNGALGIVFRDNTRLSIGPETELTLTRFVFAPAQNRFGFLTRIAKGTVAYISGSIGKLAPDAVAIETPTATIGIRGTRFCAKVENS
jgi:hypothetical protein